MKRLARRLMMVLLILAGVGIYILSRSSNTDRFSAWLPPQISSTVGQFQTTTAQLEGVVPHVDQQVIQQTGQNLGSAAQHAQQVLGAQVQGSDEKPPLHQRAIEYGQYQYCQQVVNDYELRYEIE